MKTKELEDVLILVEKTEAPKPYLYDFEINRAIGKNTKIQKRVLKKQRVDDRPSCHWL